MCFVYYLCVFALLWKHCSLFVLSWSAVCCVSVFLSTFWIFFLIIFWNECLLFAHKTIWYEKNTTEYPRAPLPLSMTPLIRAASWRTLAGAGRCFGDRGFRRHHHPHRHRRRHPPAYWNSFSAWPIGLVDFHCSMHYLNAVSSLRIRHAALY